MNPIEQLPKGMPTEQLPLDLGDHERQIEPETTEVALERLQTGELETLFEERTGFDPKMRFLTQPELMRRATLIEGINDPKHGKEAVTEHDAEYDKIGDAWSGK